MLSYVLKNWTLHEGAKGCVLAEKKEAAKFSYWKLQMASLSEIQT